MTSLEDQHIEANAFAMELLMPFDWVVRDCAGLDLADDDGVAKLAKRYRVPASVMAIRIGEVRMTLELTNAPSVSPAGYEGEAGMNPNPTGAE